MNYEFIGWCRQGNSDKVWVIVYVNDSCITIWGRRGKKLSHKILAPGENVLRLIDSKINKGYREMSKLDLDTVYPEFEQDLEKTVFWAVLSG